MAKKFFGEKKLNYTEIDLVKEPDKVSELMEVSGQLGVPVIVIDGSVIVGFDEGRIEEALAK
jgi:glutaredoxin